MKTTALHEKHIELKAKMGEFAGYDMPLYYPMGVIKEHKWVRAHAGLFDVSHMGQIVVEGEGAAAFWESVTPSKFTNLKKGHARYTVLTNEKGGIEDDLIVTLLDEGKFFAVINAGRKDHDIAWLRDRLPEDVRLRYRDQASLLALQGPKAADVLFETFGIDVSSLDYMEGQTFHIMDTAAIVSRLGYTGEDGFEISVPGKKAPELWDSLLAHEEVEPIGLAARDSLRLEMGYCLYGHDIDQTTTPIEARLGWVVSADNDTCEGIDVIKAQKKDGVSRKRVGIRIKDKGVAREGAEIYSEDGEKIGTMTSGGFSPVLEQSIGQGYVMPDFAKAGTEIKVKVRDRELAAEIASMPFIKAKTKSS